MTAEDPTRAGAFGRIVCGVNGSRADAEAVRQAAILSGADGALELVCVTDARGAGPNAQATISPAHASAALERAVRQARELGVSAGSRVLHGSDVWGTLAESTEGSDLLVVGSRGGSRAGGILTGSVATEAMHRAELPVLVARPAPGAPFPENIAFASDGSPGSARAAALATAIARAHGSDVAVITATHDEPPTVRHALAEQTTDLALATGRRPVTVSAPAAPRTAIVDYVQREQPSLLVLGSGGKSGVRALGSVSEHVAHHVPCSVLIARPAG